MTFSDAIAQFSPGLPLAVAYSGGADSSALLLACARKWPGQVSAIHVHHGLQRVADDFVRHCEAACVRWQVPLVVQRVDAQHASGESPEDAARRARYMAIAAAAQANRADYGIKNIALAQHADDQVETLLLALSRGAGLPGLAAMPAQWQKSGLAYHRPLLGVSAAAIRTWLAEQGEPAIEDPSNLELRFTRNRIRHQLLPALDAAFPQMRQTFARSCRHAAQAQSLLVELAQQDSLSIGNPPLITALQKLSPARQANLLRHWLALQHQTAPSTAQLDALLVQVLACTTRGHGIELKVGAGKVLRRGLHLHYSPD